MDMIITKLLASVLVLLLSLSLSWLSSSLFFIMPVITIAAVITTVIVNLLLLLLVMFIEKDLGLKDHNYCGFWAQIP